MFLAIYRKLQFPIIGSFIACPFVLILFYQYYLFFTVEISQPICLPNADKCVDSSSIKWRIISLVWYLEMLAMLINIPVLYLTTCIKTPERYKYYKIFCWLFSLIFGYIASWLWLGDILSSTIASLMLTLLPATFRYRQMNKKNNQTQISLFLPWESKALLCAGFFAILYSALFYVLVIYSTYGVYGNYQKYFYLVALAALVIFTFLDLQLYTKLYSSLLGKCLLVIFACIVIYPFLANLYYYYYLIGTGQAEFPICIARAWGCFAKLSIPEQIVFSFLWYTILIGILINILLLWLTRYTESPQGYKYYKLASWISAPVFGMLAAVLFGQTHYAMAITLLLVTLPPGAFIYYQANKSTGSIKQHLFSPWEYKAFYVISFLAFNRVTYTYYLRLYGESSRWLIEPLSQIFRLVGIS